MVFVFFADVVVVIVFASSLVATSFCLVLLFRNDYMVLNEIWHVHFRYNRSIPKWWAIGEILYWTQPQKYRELRNNVNSNVFFFVELFYEYATVASRRTYVNIEKKERWTTLSIQLQWLNISTIFFLFNFMKLDITKRWFKVLLLCVENGLCCHCECCQLVKWCMAQRFSSWCD